MHCFERNYVRIFALENHPGNSHYLCLCFFDFSGTVFVSLQISLLNSFLPLPTRLSALRLGHEHWGKLEDVKAAYRRLSIRWHPDKNRTTPDSTARATAIFTRIAAAYNTLTTSNFDYERWRDGFTVPQLQTLEDVLLLAMKGAHSFFASWPLSSYLGVAHSPLRSL